MKIEEFKSHFVSGCDSDCASGTRGIHLNNSGQAPVPDVFRDLAKHWIDRSYEEGALCSMEGWTQIDQTRKKLAKFLGATPEETALFVTTASAISQAAFGIPLKNGDEILTWDQEYPSNFYPWRVACERSGAKLIQISSKLDTTPAQSLLDRVTDKTKVIAVSWVQYQAGAVTDLKAISTALKGRDIWLVADVIQGVGVRPFDFHDSGFDIACGGSHKFLCSSFGGAYMLIKKDRMNSLSPVEVGAMTYGTPDTEKSFTNQPKSDATRFEPGSKAVIEIIGMGATLDIFAAFGVQNIFQEASRLASKLAEGLRTMGFEVLHPDGPILNFTTKDARHLERIAATLTANRISFAKRGPGIRLSTHAFNTDEQIMHTLAVIQKEISL